MNDFLSSVEEVFYSVLKRLLFYAIMLTRKAVRYERKIYRIDGTVVIGIFL